MSSVKLRVLATRASATLAVVALAACSTETTSPTAATSLRGPALEVAVGPGTNAQQAELRVCKWSTSQSPVNFTITKVSGPGTLILSGLQQFTPDEVLGGFPPYEWQTCQYVLADGTAGTTTVRVVETVAPGTVLDQITSQGNATTYSENLGTATVEIGLTNQQAATLIFKNSGIPDEPPGGCTYTQGYWKTHSASGPAKKTDPTWATLPGGLAEETIFYSAAHNFFDGKTWYEVFWTPPKGGNVDIKLAHQFMAAYLSTHQANPATMTAAVQAAYTGALNYFTGVGTAPTKEQKQAWHDTLDRFANGLEGTPHCSDEVSSISSSSDTDGGGKGKGKGKS